jgi:dipeptidase
MIKTRLPFAYSNGNPGKFDRASAYHAHRYVSNIAEFRYSYAIQDINDAQKSLEGTALSIQKHLDDLTLQGREDEDTLIRVITEAYTQHATNVVRTFWELADEIVFKYSDGFIYSASNPDGSVVRSSPGYSLDWLKAVGYENGPPPVTSDYTVKKERLSIK